MATPAWTALEDEGRRIFGEVEETSLEEVLCRIRAQTSNARVPSAPAGDVSQHVRPTAGGASGGAAPSPATQLRASTAGLRLAAFLVPELQLVVANHFHATRSPELVVGGSRPLSLVYFLVATLIATHNYAVVVVDAEARFEVQRLLGMRPVVHGGEPMSAVSETDLQHVHVFRADPRWRAPLRELVAAAEERALYGMQRRRDRPLWGTLAVGGTGAVTGAPVSDASLAHGAGSGAALVTGVYGWLRVDALKPVDKPMREQRLTALLDGLDLGPENGQDSSLPERWPDEDGGSLQEAKDLAWVASSAWGSFTFGLFSRSVL